MSATIASLTRDLDGLRKRAEARRVRPISKLDRALRIASLYYRGHPRVRELLELAAERERYVDLA